MSGHTNQSHFARRVRVGWRLTRSPGFYLRKCLSIFSHASKAMADDVQFIDFSDPVFKKGSISPTSLDLSDLPKMIKTKGSSHEN